MRQSAGDIHRKWKLPCIYNYCDGRGRWMPDVSVVDTIENKTSVDSYVGIDTTAKTLVTVQNGQNPYETIAEGKNSWNSLSGKYDD